MLAVMGRKNPRARKRARVRAAKEKKRGAGLQEWNAQTHERAFKRAYPDGTVVQAGWDEEAGVWRLRVPLVVTSEDAVVVVTAENRPKLLVATVPFGGEQPSDFGKAGELRYVSLTFAFYLLEMCVPVPYADAVVSAEPAQGGWASHGVRRSLWVRLPPALPVWKSR